MIWTSVYWRYWRRRLNLQNHKIQHYFWTALIFLAITGFLIAFSLIFRDSNLWSEWNEAIGNANSFCEYNHNDSVVKQRINTWSNLGYLIVGLVCVTLGIHDIKYQRFFTENLFVKYPVFLKHRLDRLVFHHLPSLFLGLLHS